MPPRNHDQSETYSNSAMIQAPWVKGATVVSVGVDAPGEYSVQAYVYQNSAVTTTADFMFGIHADGKALIDKLPGCFEDPLIGSGKGILLGPFLSKCIIVDATTPLTVVANELQTGTLGKIYAWLGVTRLTG